MITTFIVDLAVDDDDNVKILELGRAYRAGFNGYSSARDQQLWGQIILPFYKELGKPVYKIKDSKKKDRLDVFEPFSTVSGSFQRKTPRKRIYKQKLDDTVGLVIAPDVLSDEEYLYYRRNYPKIGIIDPYFPLNAAFNNKAIFASLYGDMLKDYTPTQKVYPKYPWEILADQILTDFSDTELFFIKSPEASQGKRVFPITREELEDPDFFQTKMNGKAKSTKTEKVRSSPHFTLNYAFRYFASSRQDPLDQFSGNFVVQEAINIKPQEFDDKRYKPTMRIVLSAWQDTDSQVQMEFHEGYWKLPSKPITNDEHDRDALVSKIKGKRALQSAGMDADTYHNVCHQLESALKPMLKHAMTKSPVTVAKKLLAHDDEATQLSGLRFALRNKYFYATQSGYPDEISDRIREIAKNNPAINMYLHQYLATAMQEKQLPEDARQDVFEVLPRAHKPRAKKHLSVQMKNSSFAGQRIIVPRVA